VDKGSSLGERVQASIATGELVSDDLVAEILEKHLTSHDDSSRGILLDGFPRTVAQTEALNASGCAPSLVMVMEVHDEVLRERAEQQAIPAPIQMARKAAHANNFDAVIAQYGGETTVLTVDGNQSAQLTFDRLLTAVEHQLPLHQPLLLQPLLQQLQPLLLPL